LSYRPSAVLSPSAFYMAQNPLRLKTLEVKDFDKKKTIVPNLVYLAWVSWDQRVLGFLVNSLSPKSTPMSLGSHMLPTYGPSSYGCFPSPSALGSTISVAPSTTLRRKAEPPRLFCQDA
jgi:hypothetical protein